jgi:hypothetical protein
MESHQNDLPLVKSTEQMPQNIKQSARHIHTPKPIRYPVTPFGEQTDQQLRGTIPNSDHHNLLRKKKLKHPIHTRDGQLLHAATFTVLNPNVDSLPCPAILMRSTPSVRTSSNRTQTYRHPHFLENPRQRGHMDSCPSRHVGGWR